MSSNSGEQKPFVTGGVIDGKAVAATIREEIAATVRLLKEKHGKVRCLQQHCCPANSRLCTARAWSEIMRDS
jgi:hypothetical protein